MCGQSSVRFEAVPRKTTERAFENVTIAKDRPETTLVIGPILLLDEDGYLTNRNTDKAEMFNAFFTSVLNTQDTLWNPWSPKLEDDDSKKDKFPVSRELVFDFLLQSKLSDGSHPRVFKTLVEVIGRALSMIFHWSEEFEEVSVGGNWYLSQF